MDFKELMNTTEYDFLRTNERLGNRIMLLGLGGSEAIICLRTALSRRSFMKC